MFLIQRRLALVSVVVLAACSGGGGRAPGAPADVVATPGDGEVFVRWTSPSDSGSSPILSYSVTTTPGGVVSSVSGTALTVSGLTNGTPYTFTVHATNAAGNSPESPPSSPVTPTASLSATPGAPREVVAVAGNGQATISWAVPLSEGDSPITAYAVTSNPGAFSATTTGATTATVVDLSNGTSYTFTVVASNASGSGPASANSNAVIPSGTLPPGAPTNVLAIAGELSATVSWTAPIDDGGSVVTGYTVTSTPEGHTATTTGATSANVEGLIAGTSYTFTVHATNGIGSGPESTASNAVSPTCTAETEAELCSTHHFTCGGATVTDSCGVSRSLDCGGCASNLTCQSNACACVPETDAEFCARTGLECGYSAELDNCGIPREIEDCGPCAGQTPNCGCTNDPGYACHDASGQNVQNGDGRCTCNFKEPSTICVNHCGWVVTDDGCGGTAALSCNGDNSLYIMCVTCGHSSACGPGNIPDYGPGNCGNCNPGLACEPVGSGTGINQCVTQGDNGTPSMPTDVTATAVTGGVTVSWTAPSDDGGQPITGYTMTSMPYGIQARTEGETSVTVTGLVAGNRYTFSVHATNANGYGAESAASNAVAQ